MKCPFCSHENTRVIDSRPADENNSIRRRRVCDECGQRSEYAETYDEALEKAIENGWVHYEHGNKDYCPNCKI